MADGPAAVPMPVHEHDRALPRKMLAEMPHLLRPCPTWTPRDAEQGEGAGTGRHDT